MLILVERGRSVGVATYASGVEYLGDRAYTLSSSYSLYSCFRLSPRRLILTSRLMRTRQPCSATIRLRDVLVASPGNFLAL